MELENIKAGIAEPKKLIEKIISQKPAITDKTKLYDIRNHDVMNPAIRPKKMTKKTIQENGEEKVITEWKEVARIALAEQKTIVEQRANILCANKIILDASPTTDIEKSLLELLKKVWDDNKLDYETIQLLTNQMKDTEAAEIWYAEDAEEGYWINTANAGVTKRKLRFKSLESNGGDEMFPVFDKYGDMIAFCRNYKLMVIDDNFKEKEYEYFDIYTNDINYHFVKKGRSWEAATPATSVNPNKKIPIIYHSQEDVEWADQQTLINQKEILYSNHSETNKRFAWPTAVFKGLVKGLPDADEYGKAIELEGDGASAEIMTWDNAPESVKMEKENLDTEIEVSSGTIKITLDRMKALGTYSGVALRILFMNAHLKAAQKEAIFGKGIQRRINLLKSLLCEMNNSLKPALNMNIKPKFSYFLPKNTVEELANIVNAKKEGLQSEETSIMQNPLIEDPESEIEKIKKEKEQAAQQALPVKEGEEGDGNLKVA